MAVGIRMEKIDKHKKTAHWMEIILDIAVTHSQGAKEQTYGSGSGHRHLDTQITI